MYNEKKSDEEEGDSDDSDLLGDITISKSKDGNTPPTDFIVEGGTPKDWVPEGWAAYVVFVCKSTRCTDLYLNVFCGDAKNLQKSGAKSRKTARSEKKVEKNLDRSSPGS